MVTKLDQKSNTNPDKAAIPYLRAHESAVGGHEDVHGAHEELHVAEAGEELGQGVERRIGIPPLDEDLLHPPYQRSLIASRTR